MPPRTDCKKIESSFGQLVTDSCHPVQQTLLDRCLQDKYPAGLQHPVCLHEELSGVGEMFYKIECEDGVETFVSVVIIQGTQADTSAA